ncbi:lanthionine synthetase C family protein [Sinomicrobium weinanense]|uniref:Lanthionine synthetase C family protein n=1 Tax=Sinomicrobium weinanense TaxID=2842200 RepID=A0A926JUT5_9FLAO|nr:lanthionine synthetase C family protein [Sinomicrobium weinanense]MBC9797628.1 lanthionine synthetase C family protein [Sinomicrobium weinanense]MBU3125248.1 lanthionine synthetase C family protein [Sinomicrobium weinanense]
MEKEELLHAKLKEISHILREKYKESDQTGVLAGTSGIALFQFHYSKFLDTDEFADIGAEILTDGIERINNGYGFPTYCSGLAGTGWVVDHLEQQDFMDAESDELLAELDHYLHGVMVSDIKEGNYDFLHGALGYGFYFLKRYGNTRSAGLKERYKNHLYELIGLLSELAETDGDKIKWLSVLNRETGEKGYNLSLSHGMSSIVNFLSRLYKHDIFRTQVHPLLKGGVAYILSHKNEDSSVMSLFPAWVKEGEDYDRTSRLAWCYGDPGVGVSLWQASKSLEDTGLGQTAVEILKHATRRTAPESSMVRDAGLCHGSFGNAQIFNRMYAETGEEAFREAAAFWLSDGLEKAVYEDGYAGFKQWRGQDREWRGELTLLEGIAGIGLSIISHLSGDNSWDECLMIG